jgi:Fe(3+) dicitrate transport protein
MASLSLGYENPYGLDTRIGVDYISRQFVDGENTRVESANGQEGMIDGYSLWNASINYRKPGSDITLFGSVYNLTDREYLVSRVDGKVAGRQRQFFAGIRYEF